MTMASEDLENLLKLFDYALSSDNPAVKKALKNLLLVVSIVEPQEDAGKMGPLAKIKMELQILRAEVEMLKNNANLRNKPYTYPPSFPSYPSYPSPYIPNTSNPWTATGIGTLPGNTWISSSSVSSTTGAAESSIGVDETAILKYISSMIDNNESRFTNRDVT